MIAIEITLKCIEIIKGTNKPIEETNKQTRQEIYFCSHEIYLVFSKNLSIQINHLDSIIKSTMMIT